MKKGIYVYWKDGTSIGRQKVLDYRSDTEAVISDGRVVHKIDGKWVIK